MIYSSKVGDYKFPGGGVDKGESHEQALVREVREECGTSLSQVGEEIYRVVEYGLPMEQDFDVFKMTSYYYPCQVQDGFGLQKLDAYERDLGFVPVWVHPDQALLANRSLLAAAAPPQWLQREILVLGHIKNNLLQSMRPSCPNLLR